ncbi:hypothetical protein SELMODRAFT_79889 [Selaginella moellendorffii]|uniref:Pentacotripeptide-repeat region of PRORP domain-containing protein n=2 Tax=Selaginella moellendorffii TaxID=88036 RepID=D8QXK3_SELML|nr:hypothetical protein SELMODRAFT_79889 [Selaginella moellendorffii]
MEAKRSIDAEGYCSLLRACGSSRSLDDGWAIHARIIAHSAGLLESSNPFLAAHLFHMYLRCHSLRDAIEVFDRIPGRRSVVLWTAAIGAYADAGQSSTALRFYRRMLLDGERADPITFITVLGACSSARLGEAIYFQILASGFGRSHATKLGNAIISMYGRCGSAGSAAGIFAGMRERDLITWTSMIHAFAKTGQNRDAILCFRSMQQGGFRANAVTIVSVLGACSDVEDGRIIHRIASDAGFLRENPLAANAVINMYGKSGNLAEARGVFREIYASQCVISWNTMMSACIQQERDEEALALFQEMISTGSIAPDNVSCVLALTACANLEALEAGEAIHAIALEIGLLVIENPVLINCVLHLYGRCGRLDRAAAIFREHRGDESLVSSNTIIGAFAQHGRWKEALAIFRGMQIAGIRPSKLTFAAVLDGCANLSALAEGRSIHALAAALGLEQEAVVATSLVDMYGRCGCLAIAQGIFDGMPAKNKNELAWSTLFGAYAHRGRLGQAMKILGRMQQEGVKIHPALFVSVLNSCSHAGMLEECLRQFASMRLDHGIQPKVEHFGCVIDLLGRLGALAEAERFMGRIPGGRPNLLIWMSFLGSCRTHSDLERAKRAAREAIALEPRRSSSYAVLASVIAAQKP